MKFTIFTSIVLLTTIIMLSFGQIIEQSCYKKLIEQKINTVQNQCNILINQISSSTLLKSENQDIFNDTEEYAVVLENQTLDVLNAEINQLANILSGRIIIVDSDFKIVFDTYTLEKNKYLISEEVISVFKSKKIKSMNKKDGYLEYVAPILSSDNETQGVVIITASLKEAENIFYYLRNENKSLCLIFLIVIILVGCGLSYFLTKNFSTFTNTIKSMSDGHIEESIAIKGYTEMKDMAEAFNTILIKLKNLEETRQEFVSNVSHELKTPITSIKVLADSLVSQENVPLEVYKDFMGDIVEEIDRENKIINDLLSLVKLDRKQTEINVSSVNINELLEVLLKRLKPLAQRRNIEIVFESFRSIIAEVDEVKLSLAISNLIENAIKYNVDNGWIRVSLNSDHKFFYIKVADSGVGIPEDCQEQVFERFYRVDKARSRETGGTGLGLSITRSAILAHKGAIKVYSKYGEGTTFTVRIPLNYIA